VSTRWNSTLYSVNRIIEQQRTILLAQTSFADLKLPNFEILKELVEVSKIKSYVSKYLIIKYFKVLSPIEFFTKQLSRRDETISCVLPTYKCLVNIFKEKPGDSQIVDELKKCLTNGLKNRMRNHENKRF
jgi:hypothetical protein